MRTVRTINALKDHMRTTENLKLEIFYRNISSSDLETICQALDLDVLQELKLVSGNYREQLSTLCEKIKSTQNLAKLTLPSNKINNSALLQICHLLSNNTPIKELNLADNQIKNTDMSSILTALENNTHLESLNLSCNDISDEVVKPLIDVVLKHPALKTINLRATKISTGMIEEINAALNTHDTHEMIKYGHA